MIIALIHVGHKKIPSGADMCYLGIDNQLPGCRKECDRVWGETLEEIFNKLYSFIRRRVSNYADADDIFHMTCLKTLLCRCNYAGHSKPATWIFSIGLNLIKNYYAEKKKGVIFSTFGNDLENILFFCPEDIYIQNELVCKTLNEIENLTEENRKIFEIMLEEGGSYQDVAQVMKIWYRPVTPILFPGSD
jgi:RNA polymerase sigma factor (sigma-70 family)